MGYCEIFTMNPINKIDESDNKICLHTTYDFSNIESVDMSSLIDDIQKHIVFTDTDDDFELLDLSLQNVRVLMECELDEMRTTTQSGETIQNVCFTISNILTMNKELIGEIPIGKRTLYPKILLYNGETNDASLFFYVESKEKTRSKKIQKIIKNKNVTVK